MRKRSSRDNYLSASGARTPAMSALHGLYFFYCLFSFALAIDAGAEIEQQQRLLLLLVWRSSSSIEVFTGHLLTLIGCQQFQCRDMISFNFGHWPNDEHCSIAVCIANVLERDCGMMWKVRMLLALIPHIKISSTPSRLLKYMVVQRLAIHLTGYLLGSKFHVQSASLGCMAGQL